MKNFKKTEDGLFICEECGKLCKNFKSLGCHVIKFHKIKSKDYYDYWIKEITDGICKKCQNETLYADLSHGYNLYCSKKCAKNSFEVQQKERETNLRKYGYEYAWRNKEKRNNVQVKSEKTKKQRYGSETYNNQEKLKETNLKKYGVTCSLNSEESIKKKKETWIKNLGVDNPTQNKEVHNKQQLSAFKLKHYKNTNIYYRGSYELDFLNIFYNKYHDIQNGPTIRYYLDNKNRVYYPDFYIPSLNLIIEIKSSYYYKLYKNKVIAKQKATIKNNFKYIIIIDKNYEKFKKLINI